MQMNFFGIMFGAKWTQNEVFQVLSKISVEISQYFT